MRSHAREDCGLLPSCPTTASEREAANTVTYQRLPFGLSIANGLIVRNDKPAPSAHFTQPDIVMNIVFEVFSVIRDRQTE